MPWIVMIKGIEKKRDASGYWKKNYSRYEFETEIEARAFSGQLNQNHEVFHSNMSKL